MSDRMSIWDEPEHHQASFPTIKPAIAPGELPVEVAAALWRENELGSLVTQGASLDGRRWIRNRLAVGGHAMLSPKFCSRNPR
jgi:hypothetical protein